LLLEIHDFFLAHSSSFAKHYSIKNQTKCLLTDFLFRFTGRKTESTTLELLRKQAVSGAIPRHQLKVVAATIEENKQTVREWVLAQHVLHNGHEAVEAFPHIDRLAVGENPSRRGRQEQGSAAKPKLHTIGQRDIE
jgi:hypothetical protein